jgi:hypothetical protein
LSVVLLGVVGFVLLHAEDSALMATTKTTVVTVRLPTVSLAHNVTLPCRPVNFRYTDMAFPGHGHDQKPIGLRQS